MTSLTVFNMSLALSVILEKGFPKDKGKQDRDPPPASLPAVRHIRASVK